ncbi:m7GpppX diphosphatase-like [Physella acuta]|uniref:m7GpppX diphosphatase-like n=1 Tax=Physella acuta TaxID=109671 RepID=UPI0027DD767B|nr:m7GpppX diphosphatase-like [Physella acuta]XP_059150689.1 m7GpppX diphosphatase-like [Physella acuta]XP_059150690.1 m7GpppX diphosphatase-like [Physella acuta]XP_059150692.1 m7GpppX diphosphatase-like [Physella acuta]
MNTEVMEVKKKKLEDNFKDEPQINSKKDTVFKDFKLINVLREDASHKLITVRGLLPTNSGLESPADAVLLLERKAFDLSKLEQLLHMTKTNETLRNDIYSTHDVYSGDPTDGIGADMKATLIHPATEKHIAKYSDHEPFIVNETPLLYSKLTLPYIQQSTFSIQWVYNILEKKSESERIIVEDADPEVGFVMVPDMKWDRQNANTLYMVAIVHKHGIKSIRDLRQEHLPLLENILHKGKTAIKDQYGLSSDKLRVYFHYQPSYYHLHVHFTHVQFEAPGTDVLRAHLLEDVIDNLHMDSEFYCKKTLSYVVRDNDMLYTRFKEEGYFR